MKQMENGNIVEVEKKSLSLKIMNFLTKWWVNLALDLIVGAFLIIILLIVAGSYGWLCNDWVLETSNIIYVILVILCVICTAFIMSMDIILNAKLICSCCFKKSMANPSSISSEVTEEGIFWKLIMFRYLFTTDPLYWRFEVFFIGIPVAIFVIIVIIIEQATLPPNLPSMVISILTLNITEYAFFYFQCLFPLAVTMFFCIYSKIKPVKEIEELDDIMQDVEGRRIFTEFTQSEWSIENIALYDDIALFLKEKDPVKRQSIASKIFYTYLNGNNAILEVNIDYRTTGRFYKALQSKPILEDSDIQPVLTALRSNMSDTYSRLRIQMSFKNWKLRHDYQKKSFT